MLNTHDDDDEHRNKNEEEGVAKIVFVAELLTHSVSATAMPQRPKLEADIFAWFGNDT